MVVFIPGNGVSVREKCQLDKKNYQQGGGFSPDRNRTAPPSRSVPSQPTQPQYRPQDPRNGNPQERRVAPPSQPTQPQYRFLLAPRSLRRIILHEKPDVIEVGSPVFVPWVVASASRGTHIPLLSFYHTNLVAASYCTGVGSATLHAWLSMYARLLDRLFTSTLVASDCAAADQFLWGHGARRPRTLPDCPAQADFNPVGSPAAG